jgi:hypothetical protein
MTLPRRPPSRERWVGEEKESAVVCVCVTEVKGCEEEERSMKSDERERTGMRGEVGGVQSSGVIALCTRL